MSVLNVQGTSEAEAARRRAEEQAALYQFMDRLFRADTMAEIFEASLEAITSALRCHRASILLFDEDSVMRFVASRGLSQAYQDAVTGHTPWREGEAQPEPISIANAPESDLEPELKAVMAAEGVAALAFIPLLANGGVVGKFMAYWNAPHVFSPDEASIARTIARQLSFSIERERSVGLLHDSEEKFKTLSSQAPVGIFQADAAGRCLFVNEKWCEMAGFPMTEALGQGWQRALHPDDRSRIIAAWQAAIAEKRRFFEEYRLVTPTGRVSWVEGRAQPVRNNGDRPAYIGCLVDVTHRKIAEEQLRSSEERYRAVVESQSEMVCRFRPDGTIVFVNEAYARAFNSTTENLQGANLWEFVAPQDRQRVRDMLDRLTPQSPEARIENRVLAAGGPRWTLWRNRALRFDDGGRLAEALSTGVDITELKKAEEQRTLLINELNHRVKNTLATVQSLTLQTLRGATSTGHARALLESRLSALSRVHDLLTQEHWEGARLREVVARALSPFNPSERFSAAGPDLRLSPRQALALSLALHELATNAAKYGSLSAPDGRVAVDWTHDGRLLHLLWRERGGPSVTPPTRRGFGTRLIERSLSHDLGGEAQLFYHADGLEAQLVAPLSEQVS